MKTILYFLNIFSPKLAFNFEYRIMKAIIRQTSSLFSYPILIYLEFNKEKIWIKYNNYGLSVETQVQSRTKTIATSMTRHLDRTTNPPSDEVMNRYHRFLVIANHRRKQKEIDDYIKQFPDYKPNLNLYEEAEVVE